MLHEKIISLRRKNGWSQEELAEKLDVSRQAVSKWESAQSMPDIERIIGMADLFGVSTDYLLRDHDLEETAAEADPARHVPMGEAEEYLDLQRKSSVRIALGVFLCALSPVCLLALVAASVEKAVAENTAWAVGMIVLLLLVAAAVALFVACGIKSASYEYLEKQNIRTDSATRDMVLARRNDFKPAYTRANIIAACLCVLSPIPIFLGVACERESVMILTVCVTIVLAGLGASIFTLGGVKWAGLQKLLQEGEYTPSEKRANVRADKIAPAYWLTATAIYLAGSFISGEWDETWIIWPVAGILFAAVRAVYGMAERNKK